MRKESVKRMTTTALLMALVICIGLMPTVQIFAASTSVEYVYGSNNYIYNWGTRGDTATNVQKNATLETGATIRVPIFINTGDVIRVDTRVGEYLERA